VLIIWDKLFGTYVQENDEKHGPCRYGIIGQIESNNPFFISFHQWAYMFRTAYKAQGIKAKWQVLFAYPTSTVENNSRFTDN
jgi:hypothetical protein